MIGTVNTADGGLYTLAPPEWCCTYMKRVNKTNFKWEKKKKKVFRTGIIKLNGVFQKLVYSCMHASILVISMFK